MSHQDEVTREPDFISALKKHNKDNIFVLSILFLFFSVIELVCLFIQQGVPGLWSTAAVSAGICGLMGASNAVALRILGDRMDRFRFEYLFPFLLLLWGAFSMGQDIRMISFPLIYTLVTLSIGVTLLFRFPLAALAFSASELLIVVSAFLTKVDNLLMVIVAMTGCNIAAFVLNSIRYRQKVDDYIRGQEIYKRNMELEERNRKLKKVSETDPLTKVYNRLKFNETNKKYWKHCMENSQWLSIVMLDVDYFKSYNDTYGHFEGDRCLLRIAQKIKEVAGDTGYLTCRFGGEEFAVIMPNTPNDIAHPFALRMRSAIEEMEIFVKRGNKLDQITVSVGVGSTIPAGVDGLMEFLKSVDSAMYRAKTNGRNCVVNAFVSQKD